MPNTPADDSEPMFLPTEGYRPRSSKVPVPELPGTPAGSRRTRNLLLALIIIGGCLLRLAGLGWAQGFRSSAIFDELNALEVAQNFLAGNREALYIGQPHFNGGHVPGPLWTVLWAVPLRIGGRPEAVMLVILFLNVLVIYLVAVLAGKVLGEKYRLWAALLYATAPWPVYFSVGCWNPEVTALLAVVMYLSLWHVLTNHDSRTIFWVCVMAAMLPQFHMFVLFLMPSVVILLALSNCRLNKTWLTVGILMGVLLFVPYFWGDATNGWQNSHLVLKGREPFSWGCLKSLSMPITCLSNLFFSTFAGGWNEYRSFGNRLFGSVIVLALFNVLSLGLAVWWMGSFIKSLAQSLRAQWRAPRQLFAKEPALLFVGLLLLLPILLYVLTGHSFNSRYCIMMFPLLFLLPAIWIVNLPASNRFRSVLHGTFVATIAFNAVLCLTFWHHEGQVIQNADYFVPSFHQMEIAYQSLKTQTGPDHRFRLDTSAFPTVRGNPIADLRLRGVLALARYIQIREEAPTADSGMATELILYARPAATASSETKRLLYQSNGLEIDR